jgi:hypothetical protein
LSDRKHTVIAPGLIQRLESFGAPLLVQKLVKDGLAESAGEAESLFREVKRYLAIAALDDGVLWQMHSARVDEAWHQFILFTTEYSDFSVDHFGKYVPHSPGGADEHDASATPEPSTRPRFATKYAECFGEPLPSIWYDERNISLERRVLNHAAGAMLVRRETHGNVCLVDARENVVLKANDIATEALSFIASHRAFYVRELPGELTSGERIHLVATLVEHGLLRLAA